jgi:hypothetical protein
MCAAMTLRRGDVLTAATRSGVGARTDSEARLCVTAVTDAARDGTLQGPNPRAAVLRRRARGPTARSVASGALNPHDDIAALVPWVPSSRGSHRGEGAL